MSEKSSSGSVAHIEEKVDRNATHDTPTDNIGGRYSVKRLFGKIDNTEFVAEALEKYGTEDSIDPIEEKKLVRKIDWIILPCLGISYLFYYVDKTTLSYAAIFGIKAPVTGLNLQGTQYSWLSSIFYFGWLFWAMPSNIIMQKSPTATYLSFNILMWGVLLMAQAGSRNFVDLVVLRILSGAFEAIADPAFMLITSMFYTRAEQPWRISIWYCFNGLGVSAGGMLGFAIGHVKGSLTSWRYEFLIVGGICTCWAINLFLVLPNSPSTCAWLTRDERLMAVARLRGNQTGIENRKFKWDQAREWALDVKTWLFFLLGLIANIPNGGISNFSTLIIQGLGFDTLHTSLLGIPQGAFVVIWITSGAWLNSRLPANSRCYVAMLFMLPTICGTLGFLLAPASASVGRLICFYLTGSYQASFVLSLTLITSNTGGHTKKLLTSGIIWMGACIGNIAGPFFYKTEQAPSYHLGIGSMLCCNCLEVVVLIALRFILARENGKRIRAAAAIEDAGGEVPDVNATAFSDLTDKQNVNFRYVY